jgi:hypothetical protein
MQIISDTHAAQRAADLGKPFIEVVLAVKECGHDEVQQGPQLRHVVLYGGAGQEDAVAAAEGQKRFPAHGGRALDGLEHSTAQNT